MSDGMGERMTMRFAADVGVLASVRDFAAAAAEQLGARVSTADLLVVVGELAANAAVHQHHEAELVLELLDDGRLLVAVADPSSSAPRVTHGEAWDVDGHRGLVLVDALAEAWGIDPEGSGKRVWATMAPVDAPSRRSAAQPG